VPDPRRLIGAVVALLGLVLTGLGAWFALTLGPSGTARFTATASEPLLIGPSTLNRVPEPVTVSATSPRGPVFLGVATPQDATDVVGSARHQRAVVTQFPARTLELGTAGEAALADPTRLPIWRATGQNRLVVDQEGAPESVVVYPGSPGPVDVTLTWQRGSWFRQSLVVLIVGLIILAFAGGWLWQQTRAGTPPGGQLVEKPEQKPEVPAQQGHHSDTGSTA
jgi:hypothetical protein